MKVQKVPDYQTMSEIGADIIYNAVVKALSQGKHFNLGLATGNTMIELYRILADKFNRNQIDLSKLQTWNLDEYASDETHAVSHDHPLSYWKYMHENCSTGLRRNGILQKIRLISRILPIRQNLTGNWKPQADSICSFSESVSTGILHSMNRKKNPIFLWKPSENCPPAFCL